MTASTGSYIVYLQCLFTFEILAILNVVRQHMCSHDIECPGLFVPKLKHVHTEKPNMVPSVCVCMCFGEL